MKDNIVGPSYYVNDATYKRFLSRYSGKNRQDLPISKIQAYLKRKEGKIVAVGSSAVATILLRYGKTVHSKFKIPLSITSDSNCYISMIFRPGKELKEVDMTILDEIGMAYRHNIEVVNRTLRDICSIKLPFGVQTI